MFTNGDIEEMDEIGYEDYFMEMVWLIEGKSDRRDPAGEKSMIFY